MVASINGNWGTKLSHRPVTRTYLLWTQICFLLLSRMFVYDVLAEVDRSPVILIFRFRYQIWSAHGSKKWTARSVSDMRIASGTWAPAIPYAVVNKWKLICRLHATSQPLLNDHNWVQKLFPQFTHTDRHCVDSKFEISHMLQLSSSPPYTNQFSQQTGWMTHFLQL